MPIFALIDNVTNHPFKINRLSLLFNNWIAKSIKFDAKAWIKKQITHLLTEIFDLLKINSKNTSMFISKLNQSWNQFCLFRAIKILALNKIKKEIFILLRYIYKGVFHLRGMNPLASFQLTLYTITYGVLAH